MTFATSDDKFTSLSDLPSDFKPSTRPWFQAAVEKNGESVWSQPYENASVEKII